MGMFERMMGFDSPPIDNPSQEFIDKWSALYKKHKVGNKFDNKSYLAESYEIAKSHEEQQMLLWIARKMEVEWKSNGTMEKPSALC